MGCQPEADGFDIRMVNPNSSNMNVLDVGLFSAIQSLQCKETPTTIDELVRAVVESLGKLDCIRVFLSAQQAVIGTMAAATSTWARTNCCGQENLQQLWVSIPRSLTKFGCPKMEKSHFWRIVQVFWGRESAIRHHRWMTRYDVAAALDAASKLGCT